MSRVVPPTHHHAPVPGEAQPWRPVGRRQGARTPKQGGGGSGFVNVQNRLFAPLQSLDPNSILQGGYDWLSKTDGGMTYHPGLDLNTPGGCDSDLGKLVVAPLAGAVRAAIPWDHATPGEGNHIWLELFDACLPGHTWFHIDHLQDIDVAVGQSVTPGQPIGTCGKSGGWSCAHGHSEWLTGPPRDGFYQWPYGWSRGQVEAAYWNPYTWWNAASALVLAEGGEPPMPETVQAMNDWELTNYVLAQLYEWTNAGRRPEDVIPFNPDGGLAKTWVAAMRANVYAGRPRTDERKWGAPNQGVWAEFDYRILVYKNDGTMSWTG